MQGNQIVIVAIILIIIWAFIEQKLLVTTKYVIKSARLPKQFNHTKLVVLADLHNRTFGNNNERLIKRIEELKPDYILVAGDMINKKEKAYPSNGYLLLEGLAKKYKIYYAYGNHEQRIEQYNKTLKHENITDSKLRQQNHIYTTWREYKIKLTAQGVTFLDNDQVSIIKADETLLLTGASINQKYFKRNQIPEMEPVYLNHLLGPARNESYRILIAHNPVFFENYYKWGADLVISGHLHGGMVRFPGIGGIISPQAKFFPKYQAGEFSHNGHTMVVSRGLGSHSIMPRLFNIPEVVFVELEKE